AGSLHLLDDPVPALLQNGLGAIPVAAHHRAAQRSVEPAVQIGKDAILVLQHLVLLARLLAENPLVLGFAATSQCLSLLHPVVLLDTTAKAKMIIYPGAFARAPGCNLHIGVDAEFVERCDSLRINARYQRQIIRLSRTRDTDRTVVVISIGAFSFRLA